MSKVHRNVPKLRFPGFDEAWEQRKYSDLATIRRGLTYKPESIVNGGKRVLRSSNINEDSFVIHEDDVFVDEAAVNIPYAKNGDILITSANGSSRLVGKHAIIRDIADNSVVHGGFMLLASSEEPEFVNALMSSQWYLKFIGMYVAGGNGAIGNLNKNDLDEQIVSVPKIEEQRRIGKFFGNFDTLISLQQRRLDQIKEYKKGMLQKMFPKEGETVPEVRFPGFTGEWERRKLGELSSSFEYGLNAASTEYDGKNKYIRITDIDDDSREFRQENVTSPDTDLSKADNYKLCEGDILFARTGASVGKSYIYRSSDGLVYYAGFLIRARIKDDYDSEFVFQNTLTREYEKFIKVTSMRSGQPGVNAQEYSQYEIMVPSKLEQNKIANCFKQLDTLITLHQRKLDAMKEYKKGLLQQMFV